MASLATLGLVASAEGQQPLNRTEFEFWPGVEVYVPVAPSLRAMASAGASTDYESVYTELQLGAYADWAFLGSFLPVPAGLHPRPPWYLRVGYRYADRISPDALDIVEHRLTAEATARSWIPGPVLMSLRAGADYRMVHQQHGWRVRGRARGDMPTRIGSVRLSPYASVEPTWDSETDDIARVRLHLGSEVVLAQGVTLNAFYAYQRNRHGATRNVHGIGAVLMLFL